VWWGIHASWDKAGVASVNIPGCCFFLSRPTSQTYCIFFCQELNLNSRQQFSFYCVLKIIIEMHRVVSYRAKNGDGVLNVMAYDKLCIWMSLAFSSNIEEPYFWAEDRQVWIQLELLLEFIFLSYFLVYLFSLKILLLLQNFHEFSIICPKSQTRNKSEVKDDDDDDDARWWTGRRMFWPNSRQAGIRDQASAVTAAGGWRRSS